MESININEGVVRDLINEVKDLKLQMNEIRGERLTGSMFDFWDNEQDEKWDGC